MVSLRLQLLARRSFVAWVPFVLLVGGAAACGPTYTAADDESDDGSGGSDDGGPDGTGGSTDGSGGDEGSGGDDATGGDTASGGSDSTGGTDGTGGDHGDDDACDENTQCVAAADMDQPCYSHSCAVPVAVTQSELERNPCLAPWEARGSTPIPEDCAGADPDMICPAVACEVPPPCVSASCNDITRECEVLFCAP